MATVKIHKPMKYYRTSTPKNNKQNQPF